MKSKPRVTAHVRLATKNPARASPATQSGWPRKTQKGTKSFARSSLPLPSIVLPYFLCVFVFFVAIRASHSRQAQTNVRLYGMEIFAARKEVCRL